MALDDCIELALKAKRITTKQALEIRQQVLDAGVSDLAAVNGFIGKSLESKRKLILQAAAKKRNVMDMKGHKGTQRQALHDKLTMGKTGDAAYSNWDMRMRVIRGSAHAALTDMIDKYRTKKLGFAQDVEGLKRMVKELFGESTGDSDAKAFAGMLSEVFEGLRVRANAAGASIPKRADYHLPQGHNAARIVRGGFKAWRDFIIPTLDRPRIYTDGGQIMTDTQLDELLQGIYDQMEESVGVPRDIGRKIPTKSEHRRLTFKNSENYLKYAEAYGEPNILDVAMNHIDHMAGDIAGMEIFGPYPELAYRELRKAVGADAHSDSIFEVLTGRTNQVVDERLANAGAMTRGMLSLAQLGGAFVSSLPDMWTQRMARAANGIPQFRAISEFMRQMDPSNPESRRAAVGLGMQADAWLTTAGARFMELDRVGFAPWVQKMNEAMFKVSLLSPYTEGQKAAFGIGMLETFGHEVHRGASFADMNPMLKAQAERYGITEAHWDVIKGAGTHERLGAQVLSPMDIGKAQTAKEEQLRAILKDAGADIEAEAALRGGRPTALRRRLGAKAARAEQIAGELALAKDAQNRLHEMVISERFFAVVEPTAGTRALSTMGFKRGTVRGEAARSVMAYKSFAVAMLAGNIRRAVMQDIYAGGKWGRAQYTMTMLAGLSVMGAVSYQAKQVLYGKDVGDPKDPMFWAQAVAQSGGLGIFSDFLMSTENRFGGGPVATLAGPVAGLATDLTYLTGGNAFRAIKGDDTRVAADLIRLGRRYSPGTNLWYTRLATNRLLWDQLQKWGDPRAHSSFRRMKSKMRKETGQGQWWESGKTAPRRGPRFSTRIGE